MCIQLFGGLLYFTYLCYMNTKVLSTRIPEVIHDGIPDAAKKAGMTKAEFVSEALRKFMSSSVYPKDIQKTIDNYVHGKNESRTMISEGVIKSGSDFYKRGEFNDVRLMERIDMRSVMGAYRNMLRNRPYDKRQEKYFSFLSEGFKKEAQRVAAINF